MAPKRRVIVNDALILKLSRQPALTKEYAFLSRVNLPKSCTPCKLAAMKRQAQSAENNPFNTIKRAIANLPPNRLGPLKEYLKADELRVAYRENNTVVTKTV